ncbi:MAG: cytochrome b [Aliidongia sp.]
MGKPIATTRYGLVAITLHWLIALGIAALITIGLTMTHWPVTPMVKFQLYQLHKSIGITVLLAVLLRILWRLIHRPPPLPALPSSEKTAAVAMHRALYFFMVALPMTGWALVSASPFNLPTVLYGLLPWPHLPLLPTLQNKAPVEAVMKLIHGKFGWALLALILLHAAAALRHHFILRDGILRRMLPSWTRPEEESPS